MIVMGSSCIERQRGERRAMIKRMFRSGSSKLARTLSTTRLPEQARGDSVLQTKSSGLSCEAKMSRQERDTAKLSPSRQRASVAKRGFLMEADDIDEMVPDDIDDIVPDDRRGLALLSHGSNRSDSPPCVSKSSAATYVMDLDDFCDSDETTSDELVMRAGTSSGAPSVDSSDQEHEQGGTISMVALTGTRACVPMMSPVQRYRPAEWWSDADPGSVRDMTCAQVCSYLMSVSLVKHTPMTGMFGSSSWQSKDPAPWHAGQSEPMYKEMGMTNPQKEYMSLWLNMNKHSLLAVSEVLETSRLRACLTDDCLGKRLKLIMNPVNLKIPMPVKRPADVRPLGVTFGCKNVSLTQQKTIEGARHTCLQIDLFSKFIIRCGIQQLGIPAGSQIDMFIVDWPQQAVLAAFRLKATPEFIQLAS
mmetsp:Transcript_1351/g.3628  ORF Transcript_1351/g.3628 Transcript_1351/m.3628 type:complete len:418 (+) Transcript_1351:61-1314(+)